MTKVTDYFLATQIELRELKSKCRISRNGKGAIRLQWGYQERRFTRTPPNCDLTMRGVAYSARPVYNWKRLTGIRAEMVEATRQGYQY
jgi:hypothetical protein